MVPKLREDVTRYSSSFKEESGHDVEEEPIWQWDEQVLSACLKDAKKEFKEEMEKTHRHIKAQKYSDADYMRGLHGQP